MVRPVRYFWIGTGIFAKPFVWICCVKFCRIALLEIVGEGTNGLEEAFTGGVIEGKEW